MQQRQYFIDWVRVLAFGLLILFHCAMPFVTFGWEIKNTTHSKGLSQVVWWLHQWRIPLLFFIAGIGTHFSLRKRSTLSFLGERVLRLFIPLLFAMFFTIPLQVYFEWLQKGKINIPYTQFYPQVWEMVPYPDGALTWSHMWFVVYLFVFCVLLLPLFALFRMKKLQQFKTIVAKKMAHPLILLLLCLPLVGIYQVFYVQYPEQQNLLNDWFIFCSSIILFFLGYWLAAAVDVWETCEKYRHYFFATALGCAAVLWVEYWQQMKLPTTNNNRLLLYGILNSLHVWMWILAMLGYAKKHLQFNNRFLQYSNQAVYPFYILHQTIIVAAGYYVVQWNWPIAAKLLVLVFCTLLSVLLLYHFIIRPFKLTRILFGLKPKAPKDLA